MHEGTKLNAELYAPEVMRHFILDTEPEISRETIVIRRSIEICKSIAQKPQTAYQLAEALDLNPQTIFQYLGGLEAGGMPIKRSHGPVEERTGRPETIFSI